MTKYGSRKGCRIRKGEIHGCPSHNFIPYMADNAYRFAFRDWQCDNRNVSGKFCGKSDLRNTWYSGMVGVNDRRF